MYIRFIFWGSAMQFLLQTLRSIIFERTSSKYAYLTTTLKAWHHHHICMHMCVYMCVCVCVYIYTYIHTYIQTHTHTHTHTHRSAWNSQKYCNIHTSNYSTSLPFILSLQDSITSAKDQIEQMSANASIFYMFYIYVQFIE